MNDVLWAAIGAGLAALLTRLAGKFIDRDSDVISQGKSLRDELREDIDRQELRLKELGDRVVRLEEEVETWKARVDDWRTKYYVLYEENQSLRLQLTVHTQKIQQLESELAVFERKVFFVPPTEKKD
jgi:chromosome segregation ATPase